MTSDSALILLVEDDPDLANLEAFLLLEAGYEVASAGDGQAALAEVAKRLPALILLDMKMPVMDGRAFAAAFRQRYGHAAPIVVVTAADDPRRRAREAAADGWVSKPFDPEELLATVARFVPAPAHRGR